MLDIPLKNVAWTQKVALFSAGAIVTTPTIAAGDWKISKDDGALANLATLPSELPSGSGIVKISLSATEMNADDVVVIGKDPEATWDPVVIHMKPSTVHDADGTIHASMKKVDGDATAAANMARSATAIYRGSVTGTATTTTLIDSGLTQADTNHWNGRVLIFTTGALKYQASAITAFDPALDKLTFAAFTGTPAGGDQYVVI